MERANRVKRSNATCHLAWRALAFCLLLVACSPLQARSDEPVRALPAPAADMPAPAANARTQVAVLAGGCFWGVEGVFEHVRGVRSVRSGYAGGDSRTANYEMVSSGTTRHAEAVEIVFDPHVITYGQILQIFFSVAADPTQLNRQGPDVGPQYRSNIFYADAAQERVSRAYIAQLQTVGAFSRPIVTRIDQLGRFYPAEGYHQDYMHRNPDQPYIVAHDRPKLVALQRLFPSRYSQARSG